MSGWSKTCASDGHPIAAPNMSIRDARHLTGNRCHAQTRPSRDVPSQRGTRVGKKSNHFDRLQSSKQRAERPVCTSITATPASEAANDAYGRNSFNMLTCTRHEPASCGRLETNPSEDRGRTHAHAYSVNAGGAPSRRSQENPLKRGRDNLVDAPTAAVVSASTKDVSKRQRDSADSDLQASGWCGIERVPDNSLSGLGLSLHPPPQFSCDRPVSLLSPRTSKKIRRLPQPGKSEQDMLQVSMNTASVKLVW